MIRGDASARVMYDAGTMPSQGGTVLFLYINGEPALNLQIPAGATGIHRGESSPLPLRRGTNEIRLVTNVLGGQAPTRAALTVTTSDGPIIDALFETKETLASIDQSWKIVRA